MQLDFHLTSATDKIWTDQKLFLRQIIQNWLPNFIVLLMLPLKHTLPQY